MTEYQPTYDSPYPCKLCGARHINVDHPDVRDFFTDFFSDDSEIDATAWLDRLGKDLRHEFVPDTGLPGRQLKYTTPEEKRAANAEYQRRHRAKRKLERNDPNS